MAGRRCRKPLGQDSRGNAKRRGSCALRIRRRRVGRDGCGGKISRRSFQRRTCRCFSEADHEKVETESPPTVGNQRSLASSSTPCLPLRVPPRQSTPLALSPGTCQGTGDSAAKRDAEQRAASGQHCKRVDCRYIEGHARPCTPGG